MPTAISVECSTARLLPASFARLSRIVVSPPAIPRPRASGFTLMP